MNKPTASQFKQWAKRHASLAEAVCMAQAFAEIERQRVDAYIAPIFARFDFRADRADGRKIANPRDLYLSTDERQAALFYADCDEANRAHGFKGPQGHCPALIAETLYIDAQNALLKVGGEFFGVDFACGSLEHRKQAIDLLLGACIQSRKAA